jgi:hypothetical protein
MVEPRPSTLSQTITFHMKMTTGSASSGRMIAVYQRPCSAMISASALLRASISAAMALAASSAAIFQQRAGAHSFCVTVGVE